MKDLVAASVAESTRKRYWKTYESFASHCRLAQVEEGDWFTAENVLAFLVAQASKAPSSLPSALAGLRHVAMELGIRFPEVDPRTGKVCEGAKRRFSKPWAQKREHAPVEALDAAVADFLKSPSAWSEEQRSDLLLSLLGFVGLLRAGELSKLRRADMHSGDQDKLAVWIRRSKTDQLGTGVLVNIGESAMRMQRRSWLPIIKSILPRLGRDNRNLFDGDSRSISVRVRRLLSSHWSSLRPGAFLAGHSLRKGGAVHLAKLGVPLSEIRHRGRWRSDAVHVYLQGSIAGIQPQ